MSLQDNLTFRDFIPEHVYQSYFNAMTNDDILYLCVVQAENQNASVYLERSNKKDDEIDGIIRVFYDKQDLLRYTKQVSLVEGIPPEFVKRWEMKFSALIEYVSTFDQRNRAAGRNGIRTVACSILKEKFVDLDILWTSESKFMV